MFEETAFGKSPTPSPPPPPRPDTIQPKIGVKVEPARHGANVVRLDGYNYPNVATAKELLQKSCQKEFEKMVGDDLLQTSFNNMGDASTYLVAHNGFVHSVLRAYDEHHHLIIRPDDIWFTILLQLNFYINANAEKMRTKFVSHEGQKQLVLFAKDFGVVSAADVDFAKFAFRMGEELEKNIVDPTLRQWFMPSFTTSTANDQAIASIIMMSSLQKFFSYACMSMCGLPSVTLLGTQNDWVDILQRIERLKDFGDEPSTWYTLLKPILTRFVKTFDAPSSQEIRSFWQLIAHDVNNGSGPTYLSGWITAFCFWNGEGRCLYNVGSEYGHQGDLVLDGVKYHCTERGEEPQGFCSVSVDLFNLDGSISSTRMVAGSVGMTATTSGLPLEDGKTGIDTLQPASGWWMFYSKSKEELLDEKRVIYEA